MIMCSRKNIELWIWFQNIELNPINMLFWPSKSPWYIKWLMFFPCSAVSIWLIPATTNTWFETNVKKAARTRRQNGVSHRHHLLPRFSPYLHLLHLPKATFLTYRFQILPHCRKLTWIGQKPSPFPRLDGRDSVRMSDTDSCFQATREQTVRHDSESSKRRVHAQDEVR